MIGLREKAFRRPLAGGSLSRILLAFLCLMISCSIGREPLPALSQGEAPVEEMDRTPAKSVTLPISQRGFDMGVGPHARKFPKSSPQDFEEAFSLAAQAGELISQNGPWCGWSGKGLSHGLALIVGKASPQGLKVIPQLSFWTRKKGTFLPMMPKGFRLQKGPDDLPSCGDPEFRKAFQQEAVRLARRYQPPYLVLGIEVNSYAEVRPEDFQHFVSLYKAAYKGVKKVSPSTRVFPTFHYGLMIEPLLREDKGPQWNLVRQFEPCLDMIAFTTYPSSIFNRPEEIPEDYFTRIGKEFPGKKVGFSEIGWRSDPKDPQGHKDQVEFFLAFLSQIRPLDVDLVIWTFLHDLDASLARSLMAPGNIYAGLRTNEGEPKPIWDVWMRTFKLPREATRKASDPEGL